jgi:hypothetical protein
MFFFIPDIRMLQDCYCISFKTLKLTFFPIDAVYDRYYNILQTTNFGIRKSKIQNRKFNLKSEIVNQKSSKVLFCCLNTCHKD